MSTCTLEQIEQFAKDIEYVWTEFVDEAVIDAATAAVDSLWTLSASLHTMRGLPPSAEGHQQFTTENGTACYDTCRRPNGECADLTRYQNTWEQGAEQAQRTDWEREQIQKAQEE